MGLLRAAACHADDALPLSSPEHSVTPSAAGNIRALFPRICALKFRKLSDGSKNVLPVIDRDLSFALKQSILCMCGECYAGILPAS